MDLYDLMESWMLALRSERKATQTLSSYRAGVTAYLKWCTAEDVPLMVDRYSKATTADRAIAEARKLGLGDL